MTMLRLFTALGRRRSARMSNGRFAARCWYVRHTRLSEPTGAITACPPKAGAVRIDRRLVAHAYVAVRHFWHDGDGRDAVASGQRPFPRRAAAQVRDRRMRPPASARATG